MPLPFTVEIDSQSLPALIVGGTLILVAVGIGLRQWWSHRDLQRRVNVDEYEYAHLEAQIQRRLLMSGLFFVVGGLITVGYRLDNLFQQTPGSYFAFSSLFLGSVLLLVAAVVVLGLFDLVSTVRYMRHAGGQLRGERQKLEEEIRQHRERLKSASNSRPPAG
jgi:hypothetical protein